MSSYAGCVKRLGFIMYYPVGWPKILSAVDIEDGNPVRILKHPRKELIIVIRERCISLWHSRVSKCQLL